VGPLSGPHSQTSLVQDEPDPPIPGSGNSLAILAVRGEFPPTLFIFLLSAPFFEQSLGDHWCVYHPLVFPS